MNEWNLTPNLDERLRDDAMADHEAMNKFDRLMAMELRGDELGVREFFEAGIEDLFVEVGHE